MGEITVNEKTATEEDLTLLTLIIPMSHFRGSLTVIGVTN